MNSGIYPYIKRIADLVLSLAGLILLCPVFVVIIVLIKIDTPGPVFFRQKRVGMGEKYFYILKFRTMSTDAPRDVPTHLLRNPDVITRSGRFLRKTSLDEIPQLINIIKGEMSIVGPRPALWNQYELLNEREKYRANDIRPGLTGLAQINGRDELSIEEKAKLDGQYVDSISFWSDVKCVFITILNVLKAEGVIDGEAKR